MVEIIKEFDDYVVYIAGTFFYSNRDMRLLLEYMARHAIDIEESINKE
ncbi:hypothetical protein [Parabacteroides sp. PF5-9]|nr:hypothetical protein [Parabacteroides sp. PF5-9]MDH6357223.1 hypothetical protein [Parabacteroides sp. PF5-9]